MRAVALYLAVEEIPSGLSSIVLSQFNPNRMDNQSILD
jgi:hypothetical protein